MAELASVDTLLARMEDGLRDMMRSQGMTAPLMVGIHTGGAWLAERLHRSLSIRDPLGTLDIAFYRDDFATAGLNPQVRPSHLPVAVEGRDVILVDDVIHTGRTIRAALNEIFDYGRPDRVRLAVLIDRGERELPVAPDICAGELRLEAGQRVKLRGPEPLDLVIGMTQ